MIITGAPSNVVNTGNINIVKREKKKITGSTSAAVNPVCTYMVKKKNTGAPAGADNPVLLIHD